MQQVMSVRTQPGSRDPRVAALLSACPGLGQLYAGFLGRGIFLYTALIVISWLAAILYMVVPGRLGILFLPVPVLGVAFIALDAWRLASRQPTDYRLKWFNRPWLYGLIFLSLLVTVNPLMDEAIGKNVVRAFLVPSDGMAPTVLRHDLVVVNKLAYRAADPRVGDVVLLSPSQETAPGRFMQVIENQVVRRVIAGPGDIVEMKEKEVIVNGIRLDEPYALYDTGTSRSLAQIDEITVFGPQQVPSNHYFVLGDNRYYSIDSRILGFIPRAGISGKVSKIFWSWNFDDGNIRWERTGMGVD
jgi:signal peptidase I